MTHRGIVAHIALGLLLAACGGSTSGPTEEVPDAWEPQRPEFEAIAARLFGGENKYLGNAPIEKYSAELRGADLTDQERIATMTRLTRQLLRAGRVDEAEHQIEEAYALTTRAGPNESIRANMLFMRGLTYLRQAEVQNCIVRHNKDCCLLPLKGGGIHAVAEPARRARDSYREYRTLRPRDWRIAWLLNVLGMAVGDYPQAVPAQFRIPPRAFESELDIGRLEDIAPDLGVDTFNLCGGVIAEDFDGDGLLDIVTSTFDPRGPLTYYRNLGDQGFEDRSNESRLDDQLGGLNSIGTDFDNDGDIDILVLRGAWLFGDGEIRNSLLRNNGDGTFTDVTRRAGLAEPARPTQAGVWGDFDNDGDLDLYIVNESPSSQRDRYPSQLYRNNGDGTFTDIAAEAGTANYGFGKGVTAGDYDNDGDLDIYVSNIGPNRLYRNDGDMSFVDVAEELDVTEPEGRSFATWFFDYDNNGWLDLFVVAYQATIVDVATDLMGIPHKAPIPRLYRNNGDGSFTDVAQQAGLDHPYLPMGANFGDLDNDGWLDIYLSTGDPGYTTLMPNVMLRNDGGRRFQNITTSAGLGHLQKGHGVAFADFDNDGDQDIYHQLGGFFPGDRFQNALFLNRGHGNRFLTVRLRGTRSNTLGVGARLKLVVRTADGTREVHRAVGAVSSFGGSPMRQEIGLGNATGIESLRVEWPVSGTTQLLEDVPLDSMIRIAEGDPGFELLQAPQYDLAAAARRAAVARGTAHD